MADFPEDLFKLMALSMVKNLGPVNARKLLSAFDSINDIFKKAPRIIARQKGQSELVRQLKGPQIFRQAECEIKFILKNQIRVISISDQTYPENLKHCYDAPVILYAQGQGAFNHARSLSVVGTRRATDYGKDISEKIIQGLSGIQPAIVSGLALGIDTCAHRAALDSGLPTYAVLAHGLHKIYPGQNRNLSKAIMENGALVTEFPSTAVMVPGNFPARNRIVAGMTDATLVVESGIRGGSLITAGLASSYNREVFAIPGNVGQKHSEGCNWLIKTNRAHLVESAEDIMLQMNWKESGRVSTQGSLFIALEGDEKSVVDILKQKGALRIDEIAMHSGLSINRISGLLLGLEFKNVVKVLPGKIYTLLP